MISQIPNLLLLVRYSTLRLFSLWCHIFPKQYPMVAIWTHFNIDVIGDWARWSWTWTPVMRDANLIVKRDAWLLFKISISAKKNYFWRGVFKICPQVILTLNFKSLPNPKLLVCPNWSGLVQTWKQTFQPEPSNSCLALAPWGKGVQNQWGREFDQG